MARRGGYWLVFLTTEGILYARRGQTFGNEWEAKERARAVRQPHGLVFYDETGQRFPILKFIASLYPSGRLIEWYGEPEPLERLTVAAIRDTLRGS